MSGSFRSSNVGRYLGIDGHAGLFKSANRWEKISILPDGRRVYEFHPWEKKLFLVDTYIHKDVSVYDYLRRLKDAGEDISEYKTIWYYY